ncbi:MAG: hypothetical protein IPL65_02950 [Lewinellaceae bacterium]|nr:hypothetical protein [Lewinellaceae bacterium]
MESFPGCAVLVVACDMPMVNSNTLQFLLEQRKSTVFCTAYSQPENPAAPEPLLAIWEPLSVEILQSAQVNGMYSLRDTLKNTKNYKLIPAKFAAELINVNTKEDLMRVKEMLSKK